MKCVGRTEHYGEAYIFECPGCETVHCIPVTGERGWKFNGSVDKPTFQPSILAKYAYHSGKPQGICHSYVTDGRIQFLADSTHKLAGQTVDLPEVKDDAWFL